MSISELSREKDFWVAVIDAAVHALNASKGEAEAKMENFHRDMESWPEVQIEMLYHDDPARIAEDIMDRRIEPAKLQRYLEDRVERGISLLTE